MEEFDSIKTGTPYDSKQKTLSKTFSAGEVINSLFLTDTGIIPASWKSSISKGLRQSFSRMDHYHESSHISGDEDHERYLKITMRAYRSHRQAG